MHLSLYRKYRPQSFADIVRQEHVVTILKNQIANDAIGHAYLFCGPRGTGKTSIARIFSKAVNCENPNDGSPCGHCSTCRALSDGSLDIVEIDAASNNGVNEMRDLREKVQYPPVSGKYKVYIVDEVHMLTDSAFNALLKTLEEPPAHAIFILATTEPHKIPATILSRCMRLDFKLIPEADLETHLTNILDGMGKPYEKEAVSAIARAGAGSDRDMLSIAEMCISYSEKLTYEGVTAVLGAADFGQTSELCQALLQLNMPNALFTVEQILAEGKAVGVLCRDLLQMLNQVTIAKTCTQAERLLALPKLHFKRIQEIAEAADARTILRATELLSKAETDMRFVSSPRICLETAIVKISLPTADSDTDALLVRIGALEKQLQAGNVCIAPREGGRIVDSIVPQTSRKQTVANEETTDVPFDYPEEPVFQEAYFSEDSINSFAPADRKPKETIKETTKGTTQILSVEKNEAAQQRTAPNVPGVKASDMSAETLFGKFIRLLRKTSRNGVLFTMCSDLEAVFEGDRLVLFTGSAMIARSLAKDDHKAVMRDVFAQLGVNDFEVRLRGEQKRDQEDALKQLQRDFKDYPIEMK